VLGRKAEMGAGSESGSLGASSAEFAYAARGFQAEVARLLARVEGVADPTIQRLAASVRHRSDLLSSTRRQLAARADRRERAEGVFDLIETVSLATGSCSDHAAGTAITARHLPGAPVWVVGDARGAHLALTRAFGLLHDEPQPPDSNVTVDVVRTRAGARLELDAPGVELSARSLIAVVEAFLASAVGPTAPVAVNVEVVVGRVCVTTDVVTAITSADKTTVVACWELEGSRDDVA
jgi:hypothetical protein